MVVPETSLGLFLEFDLGTLQGFAGEVRDRPVKGGKPCLRLRRGAQTDPGAQ